VPNYNFTAAVLSLAPAASTSPRHAHQGLAHYDNSSGTVQPDPTQTVRFGSRRDEMNYCSVGSPSTSARLHVDPATGHVLADAGR